MNYRRIKLSKEKHLVLLSFEKVSNILLNRIHFIETKYQQKADDDFSFVEYSLNSFYQSIENAANKENWWFPNLNRVEAETILEQGELENCYLLRTCSVPGIFLFHFLLIK
jgi:hypothetical protein